MTGDTERLHFILTHLINPTIRSHKFLYSAGSVMVYTSNI